MYNMQNFLEGWMSGLSRTPGKRVQGELPNAGSNPAPSAIFYFHTKNNNKLIFFMNKIQYVVYFTQIGIKNGENNLETSRSTHDAVLSFWYRCEAFGIPTRRSKKISL